MSAVIPLPMLRPQPLGEDWLRYTGSSAFGVLWRAARLNCLHRSDLRTILGVTLRSGDDVFRRMTQSDAQQSALSRIYPLDDFVNRVYWRVEDWWPFGGVIPWESMPWRVRVCPVCARSCYHSLLFQMPGVQRCPWHRVELIDACPRCDRPLFVGFREGLPLGMCSCGHDAVNFVATVEGEAAYLEDKCEAIDCYRKSAADRRRRDWLIAPEQWDSSAWTALHEFAHIEILRLLPGQHAFRSAMPAKEVTETICLERCLKYEGVRLSPNNGLESFKPVIAALPIGWQPDLAAVGAQLTGMLSETSIIRASRDGDLRRTISRMPAYPCGHRVFLHTECMDRTVLRSLGRLSGALSTVPARQFPLADALARRVKGHPLGTRLVERTLHRVLVRGYADGARVVLGREAPELYAQSRTRPTTRFPWVVLRLPEDQLPSAQIVWTRQSGTV